MATIGASYDGFTALAAAVNRPEVKAIIVDGSASNGYMTWYATQNGTRPWGYLWWIPIVETGKDITADEVLTSAATNTRPYSGLDVTVLGAKSQLWQELAAHVTATSSYWDDRSLTGKYSSICAPTIHFQAKNEWANSPLDAWHGMRENPCNTQTAEALRFVLHDQAHGGALYSIFSDTIPAQLQQDYLAHYLDGQSVDVSSTPKVQYYMQNEDAWRSAQDWPVSTSSLDIYPVAPTSSGGYGALTTVQPDTESVYPYTYDPATDDACEGTVMGYAYYRGDALAEDVDIAGSPSLTVSMTVDQPDTDLFAYLILLGPGGMTQTTLTGGQLRLRYRDSYSAPVMLVPGSKVEVTIEMNALAMRLQKGSRLTLYVASSVCGFSENTNTGGDDVDGTTTAAAQIRLLNGPGQLSRLRLPLAPTP